MSKLLWFAVLAASLSVLQPSTVSALGNDPYIDQPRYNVFPWSFTTDLAFAFTVSPIAKAPTNPPGWSSYNQLPGFLSGPGIIIVVRYTDSPIGKYNELFYFPGVFSPHMCFPTKYQSVHRIWVDSEYSQRAGRNIWGYPKELATFVWTERSDGVSVTVTDNKSGKVFFSATMTNLPLADAKSNTYTLSAAQQILPTCLPSLQWPIDDNTYNPVNKVYSTVPVYATAQRVVAAAKAAEAAALASGATPEAAARKFADTMQPLKTQVCFDLDGGSFVENKAVYIDPLTLTGRASDKLTTIPLGMRLRTGAVATLGQPETLSCW